MKRWGRLIGIILGVLVFFLLPVVAGGTNYHTYATFGARSSDKRANIKAHSMLTQSIYAVIDEIELQREALINLYADQLAEQASVILDQVPMIWETDQIFEERLQLELSELHTAIENSYNEAESLQLKPLKTYLDELVELRSVAERQLASTEYVHRSDRNTVTYHPYARNERLWPVTLQVSDRLIEESILNVVVDFAGQGRSEEEIRSSIVEFSQAMEEERISWQVGYHILADRGVQGRETLDVVRFLFVIDEIQVVIDQERTLFSRVMETPVLIQTITVDDDLHFIVCTKDPYIGVDTLQYSVDGKDVEVLRSPTDQILISATRISDEYEEMRLAQLTPTQDDESNFDPIMPDIPLFTLDDRQTSFETVRAGRPAVINYFASWVPPSRAELPYFERIWELYGDDIACIFLNALDGERETKETIAAFIKEFPFRAPIYWDEGIFAYLFQTTSLPTTIFIDRDGRVVSGYLGMINEHVLMEEIIRLLKR